MKKILIVGAGKMGNWFASEFLKNNIVAIMDRDPNKPEGVNNANIIRKPDDIRDFSPDIVLNAVPINQTIEVFKNILPLLDKNVILSDIASVKGTLKEFYIDSGMRFVSTHPMFGPTFGDVNNLYGENAVVINESDKEGIEFFNEFYIAMGIKIFSYSFEEHDKITAYSLTIPFASTLVFASSMKKTEAPGTTFRKHLEIAKGLLSEDPCLLTEVLLNAFSYEQIDLIVEQLNELNRTIKNRQREVLHKHILNLKDRILTM